MSIRRAAAPGGTLARERRSPRPKVEDRLIPPTLSGVGPPVAGGGAGLRGARRQDARSVRITRGHLARDLRALLEVAANDQLRRRRARAVTLLIAAVTAIEARDHPQPPVPARRLGVDQRLHLVAPLLAFVGAADVAQIVQGAEDLGEPLQAAVERRHRGLGAPPAARMPLPRSPRGLPWSATSRPPPDRSSAPRRVPR